MTQLSISQARNRLTRLAKRLQSEHEPIKVTNRERPVLAILPWDLYEALEETIDILGDEELLQRLRKSIKEMQEGKLIPLDQSRKNLGLA